MATRSAPSRPLEEQNDARSSPQEVLSPKGAGFPLRAFFGAGWVWLTSVRVHRLWARFCSFEGASRRRERDPKGATGR